MAHRRPIKRATDWEVFRVVLGLLALGFAVGLLVGICIGRTNIF